MDEGEMEEVCQFHLNEKKSLYLTEPVLFHILGLHKNPDAFLQLCKSQFSSRSSIQELVKLVISRHRFDDEYQDGSLGVVYHSLAPLGVSGQSGAACHRLVLVVEKDGRIKDHLPERVQAR